MSLLARAGRGSARLGVVLTVLVVGVVALRADVSTAAAPGIRCTIVGTPRADVLVGTAGRDVICGFGGADRIDGRGGNDRILGGFGDDVLVGGDGADVLIGGPGNDVARGGAGEDLVLAGRGRDRVHGGSGDDRLVGGPGGDLVRGGTGDDEIWGRSGNDRLEGDDGADRLVGGDGNDRLVGGAGHDVLSARDGRPWVDRLNCGSGTDTTRADRRDVIAGNCAETSPEPPPVGTAPVAVDDLLVIDEDADTTLSTAVLDGFAANDTDADGDTLTVTPLIPATGGILGFGGGGPFFVPDADLCGPAVAGFDYRVGDGTGLSDVGHVTIDITCIDDAPVAVDDEYLLDEDDGLTPLDVLANDTDVDGGPLEVTAITASPANGFATIQAGGAGIDYTPDADYCNVPPDTDPDVLTYELNGGDTATVSISVTCLTDAAVAVDDSTTVAEDDDVLIDVLANDVAGQSESLSVAGVTQGAHGSVVIDAVSDQPLYTPNGDYCGPDAFTYQLSGGSSATVNVTVTCVNDAPTMSDVTFTGASSAVGNTTLVVDDPTDAAPTVSTPAKSISGDLLAAASDVDGDSLTLVAGTVATEWGGAVDLQADGDFVYSPPAGCAGPDTFTVTVSDGNGGTGAATVSIAVDRCVWYVDNAAAPGGDGTSHGPFDTLAEADVAASDTQTIYVAGGDGTSTGYDSGISLSGNQRLVGQAVALVFGPVVLAPADPDSRPLLTRVGGTVVGIDNGSVAGVEIDPEGAGSAIASSSGNAAITDVRVIDTGTAATVPAVNLTGGGTYPITALTVDNSAATGATSNSTGLRVAGALDLALNSGIALTTKGARALEVINSFEVRGSVSSVTVTDSSSGGIRLELNDTSVLSFGLVDLTTTGGTAFLVNGSPGVTVQDADSQLTASGGTALDVRNSAIGAAGLTFRSISATGGTNGIVLNGTGSAGGLTVTGAGGTCTSANTTGCSGGAIANLTGADDATVTPGGTGIVLNDTQAPSFTRMWIHDASNYGIRGTSVRGLTLASSVVGGVLGDNAVGPYYDSAIAIDGLTGSATVSGTHISGGLHDNLRVTNTSGSLDRLTLDTVTLGASGTRPQNDAVRLESSGAGATFKTTITGSTLQSAAGDLLQVVSDAGSGDLQISGSSFSNSHPAIATGGGGVSVSQGGAAMTIGIANNTFRDAVGNALSVTKGSAAGSTQDGSLTGNTIGVVGVNNSGSTEASGVVLRTLGGGRQAWSIANNAIRGYNEYGLLVQSTGGGVAGGDQHTTVTGNTIAQPGASALDGIHYNVGTTPGDSLLACASLSANSVVGSGIPANLGSDIRLRQRQSTTVRLPGYAGGAGDDAAVQAFVAAANPGGPVVLASNTVPTGGGGFVGGAACTPPVPAS